MYEKKTSTNFQNQTQLTSRCPLIFALSLLGNRWKPYILYKLKGKTLRFSEIKREIPSITERMLILSLQELENDGLVNRKEYNTVAAKVAYTLTDIGTKLQPALNELYSWGSLLLEANKE